MLVDEGVNIGYEDQIRDLQKDNFEKEKEIIGLKKISNLVQMTADENSSLKEHVKVLENEKLEYMEKMKVFEDQLKVTSRRLSKSADNVVEVNDTVSMEMFREVSSESLPFHGFPSPEGSEVKGTDSNLGKDNLKRSRSSPGVQNVKRKNRHPKIGAVIVVDSIEGKGTFRVKSKCTSVESDFQYTLESNDKKDITMNLKSVNWSFIDGAEKIALKGTV